ncbi:MAG TPA: hypothetical protein VEQ60_29885, partial [Longimicrobium sp.]|nr:hypothetical protein [Longimicrobium sp.]
PRTEGDMHTHMKRARLQPRWSLGRWRSIPRERARDEDLQFFLRMGKLSLKATRAYIDGLIGTAKEPIPPRPSRKANGIAYQKGYVQIPVDTRHSKTRAPDRSTGAE